MAFRWRILALLFTITVINLVDRQALSILAPKFRESFRLSNTDYGFIVACFQFGMMLGEFPMGWLGDRKGARRALAFAVIWWSLPTALHAAGRTMWHFAVLRFWMGSGECANFSVGMRVVSQWFPVHERAFAVGIFNGGAMVGAVIAPPLLVWLALGHGWQTAFIVPAVAGLVWAIAWAFVFRSPESRSERTMVEASAPAEQVSNFALLRRPEVWGLMLGRMLASPVLQFYWYWLPEYLYRERGMSLQAIGLFSWVPYLFGYLGSISGGWISGVFIRRGFSVVWARRAVMGLGAACCVLSLFVPLVSSAGAALALICAVLFGHLALSANFFARISDVAPPSAVSRVTGLTGIAGGLSGFLFPLLTGFLVDKISYMPVFAIAALLPALGIAVMEWLALKASVRPAISDMPPADAAKA